MNNTEFIPQDKRLWIKGLTMGCPCEKPADDCPLNSLRNLPVKQANEAINNLTDQQIDDLVRIHDTCYCMRTQHPKRIKHSD